MEDISIKVNTYESPLKNKLDEAWKQFYQQLRGQQGEKDVEMETTFNIPQNIGHISLTGSANDNFFTRE